VVETGRYELTRSGVAVGGQLFRLVVGLIEESAKCGDKADATLTPVDRIKILALLKNGPGRDSAPGQT
jgi:hypothetical protein